MFFLPVLLYRAARGFITDQCHRLAAAISYYALFSLFPLLIFVLSILGVFLQGSALQDSLVDSVIAMIPVSHREEQNLVISAIRQISEIGSGTLSLVGLLFMAWSAGSLFGCVRYAVSITYHSQVSKGIVRGKLMDFAMVLAMVIFFFFSVILTTIIRGIQKLSSHWILIDRSLFLQHLVGESGVLWSLLFYLVPFVLTLAGFFLIYWIIPTPRLALKYVWPGAVLGSILFEACKFGFVYYLDRFARYDVVFGSLGAVAAFLFWVYLSALILLFGAEIASEYSRF